MTSCAGVAVEQGCSVTRPLVAELLGPAGVGKSTLLRLLGEHDARIHVGRNLWGLPRGRLLVNSVRLLSSSLAGSSPRDLPPWGSLAQAARVDTLHQLMVRPTPAPAGHITLLDEGPVFALTWFLVFQHDSVRRGYLARWWHEAIERWAHILDVVVFLDAPDAVLAERIRTREKPHMVKECTEHEIARFLAAFRTAFDEVLARLTARDGVRLLTIETERRSLQELTGMLSTAFTAWSA